MFNIGANSLKKLTMTLTLTKHAPPTLLTPCTYRCCISSMTNPIEPLTCRNHTLWW